MKLSTLIGKDLTGFQISTAYYLELEHRLMGTFPAIIADSGEMVICLEIELIKEVAKRLPPRHFKIGTFLALMCVETGDCFDVSDRLNPETESFHALKKSEIEKLLSKDGAFQWKPGLISDDMSPEEFLATLQAARA